MRLGSRQRDRIQAREHCLHTLCGQDSEQRRRYFDSLALESAESLAFLSLFAYSPTSPRHRAIASAERIVDVASTALRSPWRPSSSAPAAFSRTATTRACTSISLVPAAPVPTAPTALSVLALVSTAQPGPAEEPTCEQQRLPSDFAWTARALGEGGTAGHSRDSSAEENEAS